MIRLILSGMLLVFLPSCAVVRETKSISSNDLNDFKKSTIGIAKRAETPLTVLMPYGANILSASSLGSSARDAHDRGKELSEKFGINDPAMKIASGLADFLTQRFDTKTIPENFNFDAHGLSDPRAKISAAYLGKADYVLDIVSTMRSLFNVEKGTSLFSPFYVVQAKLIDVKKDAVIAESDCAVANRDSKQSYDKLVFNDAELLKNAFELAAMSCLEKLKNDLFQTK